MELLKAALGLSLDKQIIWDQPINTTILSQIKMDHMKMNLLEKSGLIFVQHKGVPSGPSKEKAYSWVNTWENED